MTKTLETVQRDSSEHVVYKSIWQVVQNGVAKYVVHWYAYPLEEDAIEAAGQLPNRFVVHNLQW